jgi:phosphatidylinositol-3-phosphatase
MLRRSSPGWLAALVIVAGLASGCSAPTTPDRPPAMSTTGGTMTVPPTTGAGAGVRPDHVLVVIEENRGFSDVIGNPAAPYINALAAQGALFDHSFAVTHPSQPNYLALFSGSTQSISNDSCPYTFSGANLGRQVLDAGMSFTAYSEDLPAPGSATCTASGYARKHAPWANFPSVPASTQLGFSAFPTDFATLPTLAFVVPNLRHDMHDGTVAEGDTWLSDNLDAYLRWMRDHNSLLVLTWDEDDGSADNHIVTILAGGHVQPGTRTEKITHYTVLRTLEQLLGLPALGEAANVAPITDLLAAPTTGSGGR